MRTVAAVGILVGLVLAMTGSTAAPAAAKQANNTKVPPDFFGTVPLLDPSASDAQAMSAAGVESVRLQIYWGIAEPSPGVYDWSHYDSVIQNIASARLSRSCSTRSTCFCDLTELDLGQCPTSTDLQR